MINIHLHVEKLSVRDIQYSFFFPRPYSYNHRIVFHRILTRQGRIDAHTLARWTHSAFRAYGVPTQAFFHQLFLIEWLMPFASYSTFNQRSLYSVSPHSDQARWCKHLCSGTVDAQRLSCLGYCLRNSLLLVTGFDWM